MARVSPFHSSQETDNNAYHICDNCVSGINIKPWNKVKGQGGKERCGMCERLIKDSNC
jgi:hypothetical protein